MEILFGQLLSLRTPKAAQLAYPCGLHRLLCWINIVFFATFSCLAPGTMLQPQSTGLTVILCTGAGLASVTLDADGKPVEKQGTLCAWSINSPLADLTDPAQIGRDADYSTFIPAAIQASAATGRDWYDPGSPRGPPNFL